ncbi:hypothetical protein [Ramlibacter alkalitolerans]|uniref:MarR family transcriptional regulator n=1 Tax=Ramlibacter alkalitolerans TaxID=2039631 RepID=A0ABS1JTS0_9BURK|nr:hypothetical protein [Ramlibacter alkalitolerans]MBL0427690.1 hypothetical protein [Ramlibacter alkalitolerans]
MTEPLINAARKVGLAARKNLTVPGFECLTWQELFVLAAIARIANNTPMRTYGAKDFAFDCAQSDFGFYMAKSAIQDSLDELLDRHLIVMTSDIDARLTEQAERLMLRAAKELD